MPKKIELQDAGKLLEFLQKQVDEKAMEGECTEWERRTLSQAFTEVEEPNWQPKLGDTVYRLNSQGNTVADTWRDSIKQGNCLRMGTIFKTREEAHAHKVWYLSCLAKKDIPV